MNQRRFVSPPTKFFLLESGYTGMGKTFTSHLFLSPKNTIFAYPKKHHSLIKRIVVRLSTLFLLNPSLSINTRRDIQGHSIEMHFSFIFLTSIHGKWKSLFKVLADTSTYRKIRIISAVTNT